MPKLYHHGMLVCGDAASQVDIKKLKGVHLAMNRNVGRGNSLPGCPSRGFSEQNLSLYDEKFKNPLSKKNCGKQEISIKPFKRAFFISP